MPCRKRGRPPVKWDDKLSVKDYRTLFSHHIIDGLLRPKCHHGKMLGTISFHTLWTSRCSFCLCPYGIVIVVFHFNSGGRKAKKVNVSCNSRFPYTKHSATMPFESAHLFRRNCLRHVVVQCTSRTRILRRGNSKPISDAKIPSMARKWPLMSRW